MFIIKKNIRYYLKQNIFIFCLIFYFFFWDIKINLYYNINFSLRETIYLLIFYIILNHKYKYYKYYLISFCTCIILLLHIFFSNNLSLDRIQVGYNLISIFFFGLLVLICTTSSGKIISSLKKTFIIFFYFFIFTLFFSKFSILEFDSALRFCSKYKLTNQLIFLEQSHLGMIIIPFIYYYFSSSEEKYNLNKIILLIFILFIYIFFFSVTLYFSLLVTFFITLIINYRFFIINKIFLFIQLAVLISPVFYKSCLFKVNDLKTGIEHSANELFTSTNSKIKKKEELYDILNQDHSLRGKLSRNDIYIFSKNHTGVDVNKYIKENVENFPVDNSGNYKDHSSAVLVNALKVSYFSIKEKFFGWGINNYQIAFHKFMLKNIIPPFPEIYYLNYNDGSNNFVKLLVEFGFFSLIFFINLIIFFFNKKILYQEKILFGGLILTQMARGAGYFNGGFLLCLIMTFVLNLKSFKK